jgi:6,7-dimethyl-8-ribityllumazine synthase
MNIDLYQADLNGEQLRIAIVMARFNSKIGDALLKSCMNELKHLSVTEDNIIVLSVAGALEIPLALQKLAQLGGFNALIALGAVIRGDTYHFEVVSNEMAAGISRVSLDEGIPIANGVLTVNTDEQAQSRVLEKGADCARVAVEMANMCIDLSIDDNNSADTESDEDSHLDVSDKILQQLSLPVIKLSSISALKRIIKIK